MALELSPAGRRYGYHKDPPDHRDYGVGSIVLNQAVEPLDCSNLWLMGPVLDQGQEGSCTAHAAAADREYLHWKEMVKRGGTKDSSSEGLYSPSFIYWLERKEDGTLDQGDCGSYGRTSCSVLNHFGCALRSDFPYVAGDFSTAPTDAQLEAAKKWSTGGYRRLATVDDMKSCIASGYNFRIGFAVDEGFEAISSDGMWYKAGKVLGGHETLAIGYDDSVDGGCFRVRNSWGKDWGLAGDFWFPYNYAADPSILMDAWIQHLGVWR